MKKKEIFPFHIFSGKFPKLIFLFFLSPLFVFVFLQNTQHRDTKALDVQSRRENRGVLADGENYFVFLFLSFSFFFLVFSFPFLFLSFLLLLVYSDYSERPLRSPVCRRHCVSSGRELRACARCRRPPPGITWIGAQIGWPKLLTKVFKVSREDGGRREDNNIAPLIGTPNL